MARAYPFLHVGIFSYWSIDANKQPVCSKRVRSYEVTVSHAGFERLVPSSVVLLTGATVDLTLTLRVGEPSQSVRVSEGVYGQPQRHNHRRGRRGRGGGGINKSPARQRLHGLQPSALERPAWPRRPGFSTAGKPPGSSICARGGALSPTS